MDEIRSHGVYTRSIAHAAALIAIGAKLREKLPITCVKGDGRDGYLFWFEEHEVKVGEHWKLTSRWLHLLACPWAEFDLSLDHPIAFLKAADENRQSLLAGVKSAGDHPFRVVRQGNRVVVVGSQVSPDKLQRLLNQV